MLSRERRSTRTIGDRPAVRRRFFPARAISRWLRAGIKSSPFGRLSGALSPVTEIADFLMNKETDASGPVAGERTIRILVVDDEPINREVISAILETIGAIAEHASHGAEAVELSGRSRYDLILMDLHMPTMDGLEATRLIRLQPGNRQVPIIALTGDAMTDAHRRCIASGMDGVVTKPFSMGRLLDVVQSSLSEGRKDEPAS